MKGFTKKHFNAMTITNATSRERYLSYVVIPKLRVLGKYIASLLSKDLEDEFYLHHKDLSSIAISTKKESYQDAPYFEIGITDSFLYVRYSFPTENIDVIENLRVGLRKIPNRYEWTLKNGYNLAPHVEVKNNVQILSTVMSNFRTYDTKEIGCGVHFMKGTDEVEDDFELLQNVDDAISKLYILHKSMKKASRI